MWCSVSRGAAQEARRTANEAATTCRAMMSILPALKSEEFFRSCGGCASDFFQRYAASFCDFFGHEPRIRRLAPLSTKRNRREIRTIGFDHEAVDRHLRGDFKDLFAIFEGHDSGEGNEMAEINDFIRLIERAAKTMKDAADLPAIITQNFECIIPGIPLMNDDVQP